MPDKVSLFYFLVWDAKTFSPVATAYNLALGYF